MSDAPFLFRATFLFVMVLTSGGLIWPNAIGLAVIGFMAWRKNAFAESHGRRVFLLCLTPLAVTIAMILFAAAMYGHATTNLRWPLHLLWAFLALQAIASVICLILSPGFRSFAASIMLFTTWLGILGWFVSSMALTDSWL